MSFDYTAFFRQDLPPAANAFSGFPQYNFVGGHNDADSVPVMGLVDALSTAMKKDGRHLATYGMNSGAQGYLPLRTYIAQMLETEPDWLQIPPKFWSPLVLYRVWIWSTTLCCRLAIP